MYVRLDSMSSLLTFLVVLGTYHEISLITLNQTRAVQLSIAIYDSFEMPNHLFSFTILDVSVSSEIYR